MQETEFRFRCAFQRVPVSAHGFEQAEGADDIGLDEIFRAVDRAVHMGLRCKIYDGPRLVFSQQFGDQCRIADVAVGEDVAGVVFQADQVLEIAGVGEFVEIDDGLIAAGQPVEHKIGADESGAASD